MVKGDKKNGYEWDIGALEKIDFKNEDWKEYFDGLKNILRIAVANKSSVRYY